MLYFVLTWLAWKLDWVVTVMMLCYFSFAGACITHNSMHVRTFKGETGEVLWRCALYGHPVSTFVPGHNLSHHRHTQRSMDPMRTTKVRYELNWLNLLMFQPSVAWDVLQMDVRYMALKKHCGDSYFWSCAREWWLLYHLGSLWSLPDIIPINPDPSHHIHREQCPIDHDQTMQWRNYTFVASTFSAGLHGDFFVMLPLIARLSWAGYSFSRTGIR